MKTIVDLDEGPSDYFSLIERVGSQGKYQKIVFLIMAVNWFVAAILLMGTSFLYLTPDLDCEDPSLSSEQCEKHVCSLPRQEWKNHQSQKLVESLSTQFGPYLCSDTTTLNFLRSTLYVGVFVGYMVFLSFADNYGRKVSLVLAWSVTTLGIAILSVSWSMSMANVGLFLAGAGCQSSIRIGIAYLTETVDFQLRQKYSTALQSSFGFAGILIGVLFYAIKHWRVIIIFFCFIPSLLVLVFMMTYFEETPKFLLKKGGFEALRGLNRIGYINGLTPDQFLRYDQDLTSYLEKVQQPQNQQLVTPLSVFLYGSLRMKTICTCVLFAAFNYIYLGPIIIVDKLGVNPFLSQILVSGSELIAYPIVYYTINITPRKESGEILCGLSAIFTGILILFHKPQNCHHCFLGFLEIAMIFCSRFCISYYYTIFFIYVPELYPQSARAIGFGVGSAFGALSSASSQVVLPFFQQKGYNPMILFTLLGAASYYLVQMLPETLNAPLEEEIEEVKQEWTIGESIKSETNIMAKSAKGHWKMLYNYLVGDRSRGFDKVEGEEAEG